MNRSRRGAGPRETLGRGQVPIEPAFDSYFAIAFWAFVATRKGRRMCPHRYPLMVLTLAVALVLATAGVSGLIVVPSSEAKAMVGAGGWGRKGTGPGSEPPLKPAQQGPTSPLPGQLEVLDQAGGPTGPLVIEGNLAYVGRGPVVAVADISDERHPRWVGRSAVLEGPVTDLALVNGHLLATYGDNGSDEHVVGMSLGKPTAPALAGSLDLPTASLDLYGTPEQAWLGVRQIDLRPGANTRIFLIALSVDPNAGITASTLWQGTFGGMGVPATAPVVRPMGADLLVVSGMPSDRPDSELWSFGGRGRGPWTPVSRAAFGDRGWAQSPGLAIDSRRRLAFVANHAGIKVFDIGAEGGLRRRGELARLGSVCNGLVWTGRWLVASRGCDGDRSVDLIDVDDPDRPRQVSSFTMEHNVAMVATRGDRWVTSGGRDGGLAIFRQTGSGAPEPLGRIVDAPVFGRAVDTERGRYGISPGLGVVHVADAQGPGWAQATLAYPLPGITDLAVGPEGQLVAASVQGREGPSSLHVLTLQGDEPVPARRIDLEPAWDINLTVVDRDLYLGISQVLEASGQAISPVQRWAFDATGLTLQARTDPKVGAACFVVGDRVYVAVGGGIVALDRSSLMPLQVLSSDQPSGSCGLALLSSDGGTPSFVRSNDRTIFVQRIEGNRLATLGRLELPLGSVWKPSWAAPLVDDGLVLAVGPGAWLVDIQVPTALRALAFLPLDRLSGISPQHPKRGALRPGSRWLMSSDEEGMLLVRVVDSPAAAPRLVPTPQPWASPTPGMARLLQTSVRPPSFRRLYLPLVVEQSKDWPQPIIDQRSIGPGYQGIAAEGGRAWMGDGRTIALFSSDGRRAKLLDRSVNLPAAPRLLAHADGLLLAIAGDRELFLLSRSDDAAPEPLSRLELPDQVIDIAVQGRLAYLLTAFCGLFTVDLTRSSRPEVVSVLEEPAASKRVLIVGPYLINLRDNDPDGWVDIASLEDPRRPRWVQPQQLPRYHLAATDGLRIYFDGGLPERDLLLVAYTVSSEGRLVEDLAWRGALEALPQDALAGLNPSRMAATKDWLVLSNLGGFAAVRMSSDGLPRGVFDGQLGPLLEPTHLALSDGSGWVIVRGYSNGTSIDSAEEDFRQAAAWVDLDSLTVERGGPAATTSWFADAPAYPGPMVRFGTVLCIGPGAPDKDLRPRHHWLAVDAADPRKLVTLGRMAMPRGIHWLTAIDAATAIGLSWDPEAQPASSLHLLDLADVLHPRVIETLPLEGELAWSARRFGDWIAVRMAPPGGNGVEQVTFHLLRARKGSPLEPIATIPSPAGSFDSSLFIEDSRAFLSFQGFRLVDEARSVNTIETQVFDLTARPPTLLGGLPIEVHALGRVGSEVFALLPDPAEPWIRALATVSLADPPSASRIRQRIDLRGARPHFTDGDAVIGDISALEDGTVVLPVLAENPQRIGPHRYLIQRLRRSAPGGDWLADPGIPLEVDGVTASSFSYADGWLAFLEEEVPINLNERLHLLRLAP